MSRILAIDTATNSCSAAIAVDGDVVASRTEPMVRGHAERLVPMIGEVLTEAAIASRALELIAVTVGPGAFTGLRVGLATARGLALAADLPCMGFTTTETIAAAATEAGTPLLVALDSKRADLYVQAFDAGRTPITEPAAVLPDELGGWLSAACVDPQPLRLSGDAAERAAETLAGAGYACSVSGPAHPDAAVLARLAAGRWRPGDTVAKPAPLYLRPPDAVVPADGGRLR